MRRGECPRAGAVVAGDNGELEHEEDYNLAKVITQQEKSPIIFFREIDDKLAQSI